MYLAFHNYPERLDKINSIGLKESQTPSHLQGTQDDSRTESTIGYREDHEKGDLGCG